MSSSEKLNSGANQGFYGWKLVAGLWALYFLNMGFPLYGGAVINTYMLKQIAMPRAVYGFGFMLLNFFVGVPAVLVAASIVRWGLKTTFVLGSALIAVGALWMAFVATEPWHYLVGFGGLIGAGIGFCTIVPLSTAVTRWFKRYRGRAMAVVMTASGFAGFAGAPLMNSLMAKTGGNWRMAWEFVAGIAVVSAVVALFTVKEKPEDMGQVPDGIVEETPATAAASAAADWTPAEAYATLSFWMILIGYVACNFPFYFFTAHWMLHLKGVGISPATAAFAMGLFTMGGIFGRLIGGSLIDKLPARFVFMGGLACYIAGSFLALEVSKDNLTTAYAAAILYGAAFGWAFVCVNTIAGNFYGAKAFPKINGMLLLLSSLICCPSALIGGKIFDAFKSYQPAFLLNAVLAVIGILALAFARPPQKKLV